METKTVTNSIREAEAGSISMQCWIKSNCLLVLQVTRKVKMETKTVTNSIREAEAGNPWPFFSFSFGA